MHLTILENVGFFFCELENKGYWVYGWKVDMDMVVTTLIFQRMLIWKHTLWFSSKESYVYDVKAMFMMLLCYQQTILKKTIFTIDWFL